jgi:flagellar basal-body rod modification protein FlgD
MNLKTEDFIKMMVTQLQNQDPLEPTKNQELLAQMSQIGQLQSTDQLQQSLQGLVLQNQIGAAGNLIGKTVQGLDDNDESVEGLVNSVRVQQDDVYLELDNGKTLQLAKVTQIAPGPNTTTDSTSAAQSTATAAANAAAQASAAAAAAARLGRVAKAKRP